MATRLSEFDVVELLADEAGDRGAVAAGERGTVLELFDDGTAMIEIVDADDGSTTSMLYGIPADRLRVTWSAKARIPKRSRTSA